MNSQVRLWSTVCGWLRAACWSLRRMVWQVFAKAKASRVGRQFQENSDLSTASMFNSRLLPALSVGVLVFTGCATYDGKAAQHAAGKSRSTPANHSVYQQMAQAGSAYDSEQWLQASKSYRQVLESTPNDAYVWFRLGNSLTQLGQYAQAVMAYEASLAADNGQFKAWFNLSTTHLLNAKVVTLNALRSLGRNDPSRKVVERRLSILTAMLK